LDEKFYHCQEVVYTSIIDATDHSKLTFQYVTALVVN